MQDPRGSCQRSSALAHVVEGMTKHSQAKLTTLSVAGSCFSSTAWAQTMVMWASPGRSGWQKRAAAEQLPGGTRGRRLEGARAAAPRLQ